MNLAAALDVPSLQRYLLAQGVPVTGPLQASLITGGRSNLTYRLFDDNQQWVLRRPPTAGLTPSAHDVGREYRIVDALQLSGVPVPPTVCTCADPAIIGAPFTVVGFVAGRVLRTQADLSDVTDPELKAIHDELIRVLAQLHSVPVDTPALAGFGRPAGFVERQITLWRTQWERLGTRQSPDLERLYTALVARAPRGGRSSVVHGDFRIDNTLLAPDRLDQVVALVDWEMATLGDPLTDVAMMCAYQNPEFDHVVGERGASTSTRWPGVDAIIGDYARLTGADTSEIDSYLGLAYLKLAVIAEGISARHDAGASAATGADAGYATSRLAVPGLLAAGLAAMAGTR